MTAREWIDRYAAAMGVTPPTDAEVDDLLALAAAAAHQSERIAAPVACWLAARAGADAATARAKAESVA